MRILFLSQWFEPEPAFKGLQFVTALRSQGHEVEVATAFPNYPSGKVYPGYSVKPYQRETMDGVLVHRLAIWPSHDASSLRRAANYLSFFLSSLLFGLLRVRRFDAVYVYHPPLTPALAAAIFCPIHRVPFIIDVQDLWPDTVASSGMTNPSVVRMLDGLCRFVYRRAAMIVAQSDGILQKLAERGANRDKLVRIYNWSTYATPLENSALSSAPARTGDTFDIVYGGNLGQAQALDSVIEAAVRAHRDNPRIRLHLYGGGIERARLAGKIAAEASDCVTLHPSVSRDEMDRVFDRADALVLQLRADPLFEITVPSKVQHYLSCGKPIVAAIRGEAAQLLGKSGAALVVEPENAEELAAAFGSLAGLDDSRRTAMGQRGAAYYRENLAFPTAIDETLAVIETAVARGGGGRPEIPGNGTHA